MSTEPTTQDNERAIDVPLEQRLSLSPEEASALTGIGLTRIRQAASSGDLEAHKHGRRTIILREDLRTWIKAMPKAGKKTVREMEVAA